MFCLSVKTTGVSEGLAIVLLTESELPQRVKQNQPIWHLGLFLLQNNQFISRVEVAPEENVTATRSNAAKVSAPGSSSDFLLCAHPLMKLIPFVCKNLALQM